MHRLVRRPQLTPSVSRRTQISPSDVACRHSESDGQGVSAAGSHLHGDWIVILRCLSRWAFVAQVASGAPTDLTLFTTVDPHQRHDLKKSWWNIGRKQAGPATSPKAPMQPGTLIDAGMRLSADFMSKAPAPGAPVPSRPAAEHLFLLISSIQV